MSFRDASPNHISTTTNSLHRVKTERAFDNGKHGKLNDIADNSAAFPSLKQILLFSSLPLLILSDFLDQRSFWTTSFISHLSTRFYHDFNITYTVLLFPTTNSSSDQNARFTINWSSTAVVCNTRPRIHRHRLDPA